jgi:phosphoribosyl 1,2-cyclic phosphate phosphodiesterase
MTVQGRFLFLGTGSSLGVPVIGCNCSVCTSNLPHNQRLRSAGLLEIGPKRLLIDAGPDIRAQLLRANIHKLDGLLLTHAHYDHIAGLDDLRAITLHQHMPIPCLMSRATWDELFLRFDYLFPSEKHPDRYPRFLPSFLPDSRGKLSFINLPIHYCTYAQAHMEVNGYRIGDFAYLTDILHYPPTIFEDLQGVKTLVISALRTQPQHLHFTIDQAIAFAQKAQVPCCYFTHIAHEVDYAETQKQLPASIFLAYDGLSLPFTLEEHYAIS